MREVGQQTWVRGLLQPRLGTCLKRVVLPRSTALKFPVPTRLYLTAGGR